MSRSVTGTHARGSRTHRCIQALLVTLAVCGCSDPREASKDNFESALNDYLAQKENCVSLDVQLPLWSASAAPAGSGFETGNLYEGKGVPANASSLATVLLEMSGSPVSSLTPLIEAELVETSEREQAVVAADDGPCFRDGKLSLCLEGDAYTVPAKLYTPSSDLAEALRKEVRRSSVCYGRYEVVEVVGFTEPSDALGARVSEVEYSYHLTDVPSWARSDALQKAGFPDGEAEPRVERDALVLTDTGWVHERLYGRREAPSREPEADAAVESIPEPDFATAIPVAALAFSDATALEREQRKWFSDAPTARTLVYLVRKGATDSLRKEAFASILDRELPSESIAAALSVYEGEMRKRTSQRDPEIVALADRAATMLIAASADADALRLAYVASTKKVAAATALAARAATNEERIELIRLVDQESYSVRELAELKEIVGLRVLSENPSRQDASLVQRYCQRLFGETQRLLAGKPLSQAARARLQASTLRVGTESAPAPTRAAAEPPVPDVGAAGPPDAAGAAPEAPRAAPTTPAAPPSPASPRPAQPDPTTRAKIEAAGLMQSDPCRAVEVLAPFVSDERVAAMQRLAREDCNARR